MSAEADIYSVDDAGRPTGFCQLHGFEVVPSLQLLLTDPGKRPSRTQHGDSPVWTAYGASGVAHWVSVPPSTRREYHARVYAQSHKVNRASDALPSATPAQFMQLEKQLRERVTVTPPCTGCGTLNMRRPVALLDGYDLAHVQATRMEPGATIGAHTDHVSYGQIIITVALQGVAELLLRKRKGGETTTLQIREGDAYVLFGQARSNAMTHAVAYPRARDGPRFSLTYRFVPSAAYIIQAQAGGGSVLEPGTIVEARCAEGGSDASYPSVYPALVLGEAVGPNMLHQLARALGRGGDAVEGGLHPHVDDTAASDSVRVVFLHTGLYDDMAPDDDEVRQIPRASVHPLKPTTSLHAMLVGERSVVRCGREYTQDVPLARRVIQGWDRAAQGQGALIGCVVSIDDSRWTGRNHHEGTIVGFDEITRRYRVRSDDGSGEHPVELVLERDSFEVKEVALQRTIVAPAKKRPRSSGSPPPST